MNQHKLILKKAAVHNLKSVNLELLPNQLVVFTGLSGSGKSSLAFDTLYVEGQRRYVESLSTFARRYLGDLPKPDIESISGLSPTISIEQKTAGRNPRSTVGTMTEIYDYLRVLYARIGTTYCPISGEKLSPLSKERIIKLIQSLPEGREILVLSPYAKGKKGEFKDDLESFLRKGFTKARVDGTLISIGEELNLDRRIAHDIDLVIDRLTVTSTQYSRIAEAVTVALELASGVCLIQDLKTGEEQLFSIHAYSFKSGISYDPLEPHDFSFNSPAGMCPFCHGLGKIQEFNLDLIIDPHKSIAEDCCLVASSYQTVRYGNIYDNLARLYHFDVKTPWKKLSEENKRIFLYGVKEKWIRMRFSHPTTQKEWTDYISWKGVLQEAHERYQSATSPSYRARMQELMSEQTCPHCHGCKLKPYPAATQLGGKTIWQLTALTIVECDDFFKHLELSQEELLIANELLKEIRERLLFLMKVGLHYLTLDRTAPTLSGGEAQRVRLASQIGSGLVGVTYILDEPSIGLHPRDNTKLIQTLKHLRDLGNTVIVVEHDEETICAADTIVDFGPGAGQNGGEIVAQGTLKEILKNPNSLTAAYLSGRKKIPIPEKRRALTEKALTLVGVSHHNLKNVTVSFPLSLFTAITGVSGSGKSSLVSEVLYPALANFLHHAKLKVGAYKELQGLTFVDKVIAIDQSPIGRNPRSNPATYIKLFDEIRDLYSSLPESIARGFKPGRFSFNVKEGSCSHCNGMGMNRIDMDFMDDAWVTCPLCQGKRFDQETLSILYKGKPIADVLEMTVAEALEFFQHIPKIAKKLEILVEVGMDYIRLGQPSTTLSGGEAQRIKLSKEISRPTTGKTAYLFDEPTTGLHFHDIAHLLTLLQRLVEKGNSVIVIEHNMDLVKTADWIIDMGPEGGSGGGKIVAEGTPEEIAALKSSTGQALHQVLYPPLRKSKFSSVRTSPTTTSVQQIVIKEAEQHNLKKVSTTIPREAITIITGPSGSGKSSLAFDTIYAEGQRRYIESLSPYARQFVHQMPKPKVGSIEGLSPAIAIEQKSHAGNPRSTVGTLTEIYDYLRILYARMGIPHCPDTGEIIKAMSKDHVVDHLLLLPKGDSILVLAPLELSKGDSFQELITRFKRQGYLRIRLNGQVYEMDAPIPFDKRRKNQFDLVIDRLKIDSTIKNRLFEAIENSSKISHGKVIILHQSTEGEEELFFNLSFSVESTGKSYPEITPKTFAFNTTEGMCPHCEGLGYQYGANLIQQDAFYYLTIEGLLRLVWKLSLEKAFKLALSSVMPMFQEEGIALNSRLQELPPDQLQFLMNGSPAEKWYTSPHGFRFRWQGINKTFAKAGSAAHKPIRDALLPWLEEITCLSCKGEKLNPLARHVLIDRYSIGALCKLPVDQTLHLIKTLKIPKEQRLILSEVIDQLISRLTFLCEVGLHYISLDRNAPSLSNGEAQRIRLARQLGSGLKSILYVLDEPTVGLHPKDISLLNQSLLKLKALNNTLILVEHDPQTIAIADYLIDMGPKAGSKGGEILAEGTLSEIEKNPNSLTGAYLFGKKSISLPNKRRKPLQGYLCVENASIHNLKSLFVKFPVGTMSCITGVSGSGKSTLIHHVLRPAIEMGLLKTDQIALEYAKITGISHFNKFIYIDQNPIGHTVRSDVATYIDALTPIRHFFALLPQAKIKGLQPKHFSYNHRKGMCTSCMGLGYRKIAMHFLPEVTITCPECKGLRLNPLSLQVSFQGKNLGEILKMTIEEAALFFENHPRITRLLKTLISVGLGYLPLGQEMATLSGGEAQRMKLSRDLAKRSSGKTLYLIDEPTTGLHSDDIQKLLLLLHQLVDKGNTLILIEHHLDMIKNADFLVDLGPEAGILGGQIVCQGTPEEVACHPTSHTGYYLKQCLP